MPDGRTHRHAHRAAVLLTTIAATVGLGIATAGPAAATRDDIGASQARVERLSSQADVAHRRHQTARTRLTGVQNLLGTLDTTIHRQQRLMDDLRAQVAGSVVGEYEAAGAASAPARALTPDAEILLTNITMVSQDAGPRADALAQTNVSLERLGLRRAAVLGQLPALAGREKTLRTREHASGARAAAASATLERLQRQAARLRERAAAERTAQLGGPVLAYAKSQVGKAYVYGAAGPDAFDCSGLTMMAWSQSGVSLPHSSSAQYASGRHISESELQPGDLVFYYSPISHVGLYIGNGQIVNALNPGAGVRVSGLHDMPYSGAVRPG